MPPPPDFGTAGFLADQLGFARANIIVPGNLGTTQQDARIQEMTLRLQPNSRGRRHGEDIPVYAVTRPQQGDPLGTSFFAYWVPYAQNQTFSCMLGNGARFMFTATMDGCSFGIGSSPAAGVVRVAHANRGKVGKDSESVMGEVNAREMQALVQRDELRACLGNNARVIAPNDYRQDFDLAPVLSSTTFGLHQLGQAWEFWTQRYYKDMTDAFHPVRYLRDVIQQV
jgi:hypothetical protein